MYGVVWLIALSVFLADFFIKSYLCSNFAYQSFPVINKIFHITVVFNKGAAFGILNGRNNLLIYVGIVFVVLFMFMVKKEIRRSLVTSVSCGLILGGALSNLYDRVFLGFVVDYIDFRVWPVFNLSDTCITCGAILLFIYSFKKPPAGSSQ
ncbi:MAG: signal peptidase II [Candidatus Omnitrophica bacterium]|nr:signal peptidase II [Candidatus Omnitrophota bacterium]